MISTKDIPVLSFGSKEIRSKKISFVFRSFVVLNTSSMTLEIEVVVTNESNCLNILVKDDKGNFCKEDSTLHIVPGNAQELPSSTHASGVDQNTGFRCHLNNIYCTHRK